VQDEAGIAKRCPGCKAPKPPQENEENQEMKQLSYSEMLKKSSKVFGVRLQNIDQEGNLPLPPEEQEAAATIKELESEIVKLEGIVSCASQLAAKKKEVEALKKKMPKSPLQFRDHAAYLETMKDLEEKNAMIEKQLKAKLTTSQELLASLAGKAEEEKKKLQEDTAKALKMIEAKYNHWTAEQTATIKETEDRIKAHAEQTAETVKGMEQQAGPLTRKVAAASGVSQTAADGVTLIQALPGFIVHSNDVDPMAVQAQLLASPLTAGISQEQCAAVTQIVLQQMQAISRSVGPAQPLKQQQQQNQQQVQQAQFLANQDAAFAGGAALQLQQKTANHVDQDAASTAGATQQPGTSSQSKQAQADAKIDEQMEQYLLADDTGDEAELLRANAKPGEVVKKIKKSEKKAKKAKR